MCVCERACVRVVVANLCRKLASVDKVLNGLVLDISLSI